MFSLCPFRLLLVIDSYCFGSMVLGSNRGLSEPSQVVRQPSFVASNSLPGREASRVSQKKGEVTAVWSSGHFVVCDPRKWYQECLREVVTKE